MCPLLAHCVLQDPARKGSEQTRHGTRPTLASGLIMGTRGREMLLLTFFLLAALTKINDYSNYWCPK